MLKFLLLAFTTTVFAGGIKFTNYPNDKTFNCGGPGLLFEWQYDKDALKHFAENPTDKLEIFLVLEKTGSNPVVTTLTPAGGIANTETSFMFVVPKPYPDDWLMSENPVNADGKTKVHLEIKSVAKPKDVNNAPCWVCFDPDFNIECKECVPGTEGCPCKTEGNDLVCDAPLGCNTDTTCQPITKNGRGVNIVSHPSGDVKCGEMVTVTWTYDDDAKTFFDAQTGADGKKVEITLKKDTFGENELIGVLGEVDYPATRLVTTIPSPFPLDWIAEENPHHIKQDGSSETVTIEVHAKADPSSVTSYGGFTSADEDFELTCCPEGAEECPCKGGSTCDAGLKCNEKMQCELDQDCTEGDANCRCMGGVGGSCTAPNLCQANGICVLDTEPACVPSTLTGALSICTKITTELRGCVDGKCQPCSEGVSDCKCKSGTCNDANHVCFMDRCVKEEPKGCLGCDCAEGNTCEEGKNLQCKEGKCAAAVVVTDCPPASGSGQGTCAQPGFECRSGSCMPIVANNDCSPQNLSGQCPSPQTCQGGQCAAPVGCTPACQGNQVCRNGACETVQQPQPDPCVGGCKTPTACPAGKKPQNTSKDNCGCTVNGPCVDDNTDSIAASFVSLSLALVATFVVTLVA